MDAENCPCPSTRCTRPRVFGPCPLGPRAARRSRTPVPVPSNRRTVPARCRSDTAAGLSSERAAGAWFWPVLSATGKFAGTWPAGRRWLPVVWGWARTRCWSAPEARDTGAAGTDRPGTEPVGKEPVGTRPAGKRPAGTRLAVG